MNCLIIFFKRIFSCCFKKPNEYEICLNDFYENTEIDSVLNYSEEIQGQIQINQQHSYI